LLLRNEGKYALNGATGIFLYFFKSMFLLCLKNPLSANYDIGQNVQSVKIAVGEKFRRSKLPSVKNSVGQLPSVKMAVGQSCVGHKTWNHRRKTVFPRFFETKYGFFRNIWQFFSFLMFTTHICTKISQVAEYDIIQMFIQNLVEVGSIR
jgi:hypothetical protein